MEAPRTDAETTEAGRQGTVGRQGRAEAEGSVGSEGSAGAEGPAGSEEIVGSAGVAGAEGIIDGGVDGPPDAPSAGEDGGGDAPDAPIACNAAACPQPTNECQEAVCGSDGSCGLQAKADGVPATTQSVGDCKRKVCSGGTLVDETDDTDLPVDHNECTSDVCSAGVPSNPPVPQNQACGPSGARFCDGAGACAECTAPTQCAGSDTECKTRTCTAGACGVSFAVRGTSVAAQTAGDCKKNQCDGNGVVEVANDDADPENDGNACSDNSCASGQKVSTPTPINTACGNNTKCDGSGSCVGCTAASDCAAPTNPCLVATCTAGICGTVAKSNGTSCDDGNACTQTDTCQAGSCTGANPVVCARYRPVPRRRHAATRRRACARTRARPTAPPATTAMPARRPTPARPARCAGANPVVCAAFDQCHVAGHLQSGDGRVLEPEQGRRHGVQRRQRLHADRHLPGRRLRRRQPGHLRGVATSATSRAPATRRRGCARTRARPTARRATTATPARRPTPARPAPAPARSPVDLHGVATSATTPARCNPATGVCSNPTKADGTPCNDGNACTQTDTCQAGSLHRRRTRSICAASRPVPRRRAPATRRRACARTRARPNGSACNDGNACTQTDTCQAGTCTGGTRSTAPRRDQCHDAGTLRPGDGRRARTRRKADGSACNDGNACTQTDTCQAGTLRRREPGRLRGVAISATTAGTCDPATGVCSNPTRPTARACNDGNACTQTDTCQAGACTGGDPVDCAARDQCHVAGTCNPATGACSNPTEADGTRVQRRQRLHADRHLPGRHLRRRATRSSARRATSATTRAPATRRRASARNPSKADGTRVQRRQRLHADRHAARRGSLHRRRTRSSAPRCDQCHDAGTCNPATGVCSNPAKPTARPATTATPARRPTRARAGSLHRREPGRLRRDRPVPRRRHLQSGDGRVLEPGQGRRHARATTATPARRPIPARAAAAPAPTQSPAPRWTSVMPPASARPQPGCVPPRPSPHTRRVPRESATALASAWSVSSQVSAPAWIPSARCAPARRIAAGSANTPAGTVVATQTAGDCQISECDGAGNIVPANRRHRPAVGRRQPVHRSDVRRGPGFVPRRADRHGVQRGRHHV